MLSFLIAFTLAFVAAYLGYHSQEEIVALFFVIVAVISLVTSFVLAHWIMQILILGASLSGIRYFCYRHSCQNSLDNP